MKAIIVISSDSTLMCNRISGCTTRHNKDGTWSQGVKGFYVEDIAERL